MPLPSDTKGQVGGGDFFSPQKGQNKILIVGDAIQGYEYWTTENKPVRSKEPFEETPNIRTTTKDDGSVVPDKQKFFWAMPVYDYADKKIKVYQISQKQIRDALNSFAQNDDWGDPTRNYSVSITKEGEGFKTAYSVTPNPAKEGDKEIAEAVKLYDENPVDVEAAIFGDNS